MILVWNKFQLFESTLLTTEMIPDEFAYVDDGNNALMNACKREDEDIILKVLNETLEDEMLKINQDGENALMIICQRYYFNPMVIEKILDKTPKEGLLTREKDNGANVLTFVCDSDGFVRDQKLIEKIVDKTPLEGFKTIDNKGHKYNALMLACHNSALNPEIIEKILDKTLDEDISIIHSYLKCNALMFACMWKKNEKIIQKILDKTPQEGLFIKDENGNNALMIAEKYQEKHTIDLIKKRMTK